MVEKHIISLCDHIVKLVHGVIKITIWWRRNIHLVICANVYSTSLINQTNILIIRREYGANLDIIVKSLTVKLPENDTILDIDWLIAGTWLH